MPNVSVRGKINASVEQVYELLSSYGSQERKKAFPGILEQRVTMETDNSGKVVTRFEPTPNIEDIRKFQLEFPRMIKEEIIESPVLKGSFTYKLREIKEGTELTYQQNLKVKGMKIGVLQHYKVTSFIEKAGKECIDNIKHYFESGS
ncbi:MAG: hypothetical protein CL896_01650 [Dehalococcoidia bacterium]|nr:hypothetical protein [Dehalococcoidia bacterium]|tara:strand:- start:871 stop:1311 length:441 start_codon:yes stop_codon:yes gene_type:complete